MRCLFDGSLSLSLSPCIYGVVAWVEIGALEPEKSLSSQILCRLLRWLSSAINRIIVPDQPAFPSSCALPVCLQVTVFSSPCCSFSGSLPCWSWLLSMLDHQPSSVFPQVSALDMFFSAFNPPGSSTAAQPQLYFSSAQPWLKSTAINSLTCSKLWPLAFCVSSLVY